ncbi:MAG: Hpt domain-containing response regulator [Sediminibacterium sp.]|nr:response regulator [Chitinophagaceae bacterium]MCA6445808.1 response regulator [Chitinophagaceae bacterium]
MNTDFLKGKKILIAEDDFVNQKLITHSLNTTGVIFDIAGNGQEALDMLKKARYDLILMDINMPEMDGFEATEIIRRDIDKEIPIIAMTGWSSRTEGDKFAKTGMNGVLSKPFGLEALFKTLNEVLEPVTNSVTPEASEEIPIQAAPVIQNTPPKPIQPPVEKSIAMKMPEVDLEMLNELAEGDNEYKATIINMFLEGMPESIQKMETNLADKDWENMYKSAHYAKSSLSVVKIPVMYDLAHGMEIKAKQQQQLEEIAPALKLFKEYFASASIYLKNELAKLA